MNNVVIWMNIKAYSNTKKNGNKKVHEMADIMAKALEKYEPSISFFVETKSERRRRML